MLYEVITMVPKNDYVPPGGFEEAEAPHRHKAWKVLINKVFLDSFIFTDWVIWSEGVLTAYSHKIKQPQNGGYFILSG